VRTRQAATAHGLAAQYAANRHQITFIPSESGGKLEPFTRPGKDDNKQGCVQANAFAAANRSLSASDLVTVKVKEMQQQQKQLCF
jgi:hypothetical protein